MVKKVLTLTGGRLLPRADSSNTVTDNWYTLASGYYTLAILSPYPSTPQNVRCQDLSGMPANTPDLLTSDKGENDSSYHTFTLVHTHTHIHTHTYAHVHIQSHISPSNTSLFLSSLSLSLLSLSLHTRSVSHHTSFVHPV